MKDVAVTKDNLKEQMLDKCKDPFRAATHYLLSVANQKFTEPEDKTLAVFSIDRKTKQLIVSYPMFMNITPLVASLNMHKRIELERMYPSSDLSVGHLMCDDYFTEFVEELKKNEDRIYLGLFTSILAQGEDGRDKLILFSDSGLGLGVIFDLLENKVVYYITVDNMERLIFKSPSGDFSATTIDRFLNTTLLADVAIDITDVSKNKSKGKGAGRKWKK